jgi:hypothetical protein
MSSSSPAPTIQVCRDCGGGAPVDAHFCPQCTKILSIGRHGDYFGFLGLPRRLNLDPAELEQRFRTLSRQFHPDYFYNAPPAGGGRALNARRTERRLPDDQGADCPRQYLLQLEGFAPGGPEQGSRFRRRSSNKCSR